MELSETNRSPVAEFVIWATDLVKPMRTAHRLSNIMIDLDDATYARCESHIWGYHRVPANDGNREIAMTSRADGALHQALAIAFGGSALAIDLLHTERYIHVTQRMQG